jgi:hypothetical protein
VELNLGDPGGEDSVLESTTPSEDAEKAAAAQPNDSRVASAEVVFARLRDGVAQLPIRPQTAAILTEVIFGAGPSDRVERAATRLTGRSS